MEPFHQLDVALVLLINAPAGRSALLDKVIYDISDSPLLTGGVFLCFYWWLWFDDGPQRRRDVVVALVAGVLTAFASRLLQVGLPRIYLGYHYPSDVIAGDVGGRA